MTLFVVKFLFFFTGAHESMYDQMVKHVSPAVKKQFKSFKEKYHKTYANETEEAYRMIIFNNNLKEMYRNSN